MQWKAQQYLCICDSNPDPIAPADNKVGVSHWYINILCLEDSQKMVVMVDNFCICLSHHLKMEQLDHTTKDSLTACTAQLSERVVSENPRYKWVGETTDSHKTGCGVHVCVRESRGEQGGIWWIWDQKNSQPAGGCSLEKTTSCSVGAGLHLGEGLTAQWPLWTLSSQAPSAVCWGWRRIKSE